MPGAGSPASLTAGYCSAICNCWWDKSRRLQNNSKASLCRRRDVAAAEESFRHMSGWSEASPFRNRTSEQFTTSSALGIQLDMMDEYRIRIQEWQDGPDSGTREAVGETGSRHFSLFRRSILGRCIIESWRENVDWIVCPLMIDPFSGTAMISSWSLRPIETMVFCCSLWSDWPPASG